MTKKVLAIIRTSTIRQEIESQKKDIIEFCISKGFKEEEIVFVVGFGASARKRNEKYVKMLEDIKLTIEKYSLKYVAVWHLNRLGRTEENLSYLKEYFEQNHIQVYIKNPSLTLFNDDGSLNNGTSMAWTIFAMMIKFETIELMEKLHRGREYKRSQNKYLGGFVTYGYKVNDSGFYEVDEEESKVVKLIFDLYESGKIGSSKIVRELNEKNIVSRSGKRFTSSGINQILRNEDYVLNTKYPQIINKEQFDKCREISAINDISISKERQIHLGTKILKCLSCGCYYSVAYGYKEQLNSYLCNGAKQHYCIAEVRAISMNVFDFCLKYVSVQMYSKMLLKKQELNREEIKVSILDNRSRIDSLDIQIDEYEKKIVRLNHLYVNGSYSDYSLYQQEYDRLINEKNNLLYRKSDIESKIEQLENQLKLLESSAFDTSLMDIRKSLLENNSISYWKEIIDICISYSYLKKVEVNGKKYTAIVIVLKDENSTKRLFLYNRRSVFFVYLNQKTLVSVAKFDIRNSDNIITYLSKWSSDVLQDNMNISVDEFNEYCS